MILLGVYLGCLAQNEADSSSTRLKELVVTDSKVVIKEQGMDYTISNIRGSELASAGSIIDMLSWTPGLYVDPDNNIGVIGVAGSPLLYLNGVRVTDNSKLASLLSSMVKKLEIIRNPGAQYPAGTSSVIKITTFTPLKDMMNTSIMNRARQFRRYGNETAGNIWANYGKFNWLGSLIYSFGNSKQSAVATETVFAKDGNELRNIDTDSKDLIHTSRWSWLAGTTWNITPTDALQIEYSGSNSRRRRTFVNNRITSMDGAVETLDFDSRNRSNPFRHAVLGSYSHDFGESELAVNATYNRRIDDSKEDVYLMPHNTLDQQNKRNSKSEMWTLQADYNWKFGSKDNQSTGAYAGRSTNENQADYTFTGFQRVNSSVVWGEMYYETDINIKAYGVKAGLRGRYERQKSSSRLGESTELYDKSYFNLVPHLSVFHRFSKKFAMNLSYRYRYFLPPFRELSPAITLNDLIFYETGNPDLKVPRSHTLSLVFNLPSATIIAEYISRRNSIMELTSPIEGSEYFLVKPVNMNGNYDLRLQGSYNLNISNHFRLYASAVLMRQHVEYPYIGELEKRNNLFAMLSLNSTYNILDNLSVFVNARYSSPQLVENLRTGYNCNISFGGNLRLSGSKLNLRLAVNDILARSVTPWWQSYSPNLYQCRRNYYDTRGLTLTGTYTFMLAKKKYSALENADDYDRF